MEGRPVTASQVLASHREEIRAVVLANRATNPRVFGSVTRGEDTDTSDLDVSSIGCPA